MTVSNYEKCVNVNDLIDSIAITFVCPICKTQKDLRFPKSVVDKAKNLTTISIPKGLVCNHHFQAFVDKNYKIRGYQKVDFEFARALKSKSGKYNKANHKKSDKELFENLITEGNYLEYRPNHLNLQKKRKSDPITINDNPLEKNENNINQKSNVRPNPQETPMNPSNQYRERSLKEIYEDFWDFIDNDNEIFM
ncbi:MAG: hypothetical protein R6W84_03585, partial [Promethearchaeia archaeon]